MTTEIAREKILNEISKLLISCKSDREIIEQLEIPSSTYYNYKRQLHQQAVESIKTQNVQDFALYIDQLSERLKTIYNHVLQRITDSHRTSNRELSNLCGLSVELAYKILEVERQRYEIVFNKKSLPTGTPELIDESDIVNDGAFDEAGDHIKSTDAHPLV